MQHGKNECGKKIAAVKISRAKMELKELHFCIMNDYYG